MPAGRFRTYHCPVHPPPPPSCRYLTTFLPQRYCRSFGSPHRASRTAFDWINPLYTVPPPPGGSIRVGCVAYTCVVHVCTALPVTAVHCTHWLTFTVPLPGSRGAVDALRTAAVNARSLDHPRWFRLGCTLPSLRSAFGAFALLPHTLPAFTTCPGVLITRITNVWLPRLLHGLVRVTFAR